MANNEREYLWRERVAQWRASGLSQRAYAIEQGVAQRQISYWALRLGGAQQPGLLPVRVMSATNDGAISLRSEHGWTLNLPRDVPASWPADRGCDGAIGRCDLAGDGSGGYAQRNGWTVASRAAGTGAPAVRRHCLRVYQPPPYAP